MTEMPSAMLVAFLAGSLPAIVALVVLYFVIRLAVRHALEDVERRREARTPNGWRRS